MGGRALVRQDRELAPGGALLESWLRRADRAGTAVHPELTPEIVADWILSSAEVLDFRGIMEATWRDFPNASEDCHRLFAEFVGSVADARG